MNTKIFANAELKNFKIALKREFPNAAFKSESLGIAPNGKPAWRVTGYGEVSLAAMEKLEAQMGFDYAYIVTNCKSYALI